MAPRGHHEIHVQRHPGSSAQEIEDEPDWGAGHNHRVGFRNCDNRIAGFTHTNDSYDLEIEQAKRDLDTLRAEIKNGDLITFRDVIRHQKVNTRRKSTPVVWRPKSLPLLTQLQDFHLRHPENRSLGWRYVLDITEDYVKDQEKWPSNIRRRENEKKQAEDQEDQGTERQRRDVSARAVGRPRPERGGNAHNDAYHTGDDGSEDKDEGNATDLGDSYTPQEIALLLALRAEKDDVSKLKENDGKQTPPQTGSRPLVSIDEQDQFGPDNWLPRSPDLIRLTGKHPLNAEANLRKLFDAGLITPNELHYVRNHGAVPRLLWEFHELDIEYNGKTTTLSMNVLKGAYDTINIAVALACDGNRRKELNMIKRSSGFNWGPGAVSCAYWRGPLLRDVLLSVGIPRHLHAGERGKRHWVNFEGADEPSEGKYSTCIPFEYAMDVSNDVLLAYEMNGVPLPPDHGYPVRLIIPGYVGGRCVKWLRRIWVSDKENDSYYHVWDNRVLPSFVTSKDGAFAETLFHHPDTACNEQNLNSVIARPEQGERIPLGDVAKGHRYRIAGFAYAGGGNEVQRVEVSLDGGRTWLYCVRQFPDFPIRHGKKFWTWTHWHVDVELTHLLRADSITVRCFDVFKNTQPRDTSWNIMGMMNNCWYVVRLEVMENDDSEPVILFRHPTEPGVACGGWMKPSVENQVAEATQKAGAPQTQLTREEIEKHNKEDDCWLVVDGHVYDATSVLAWHPGGKAAIMGHAGRVHQETSDEFASIHDEYGHQKLKECAIGVVTEKAANFIKQNAAARADSSSQGDDGLALQRHRWTPVTLEARQQVSADTRKYTFRLPADKPFLGLGTCQHLQIGFHMKDKMLIRSYTPTRPLLPALGCIRARGSVGPGQEQTCTAEHEEASLHDGNGTFDLTVKTYFPDQNQPGGAMSNILDCIPVGEEVEIRGPTGEILYEGNSKFVIEGRERVYRRASLVLGGSGITPGYALLARVLMDGSDEMELRVVDANKSEGDILLKDELDRLEKRSVGQLKVTHILSHPSDQWVGERGHVDEVRLKRNLFEPSSDSVAFLCGPPAMIQTAVLPVLKAWGYIEDETLFGF